MEEDLRQFFIKIVKSVLMVLGWMFFTVAIGIYLGLLIPQYGFGLPQYIFYAIAIVWFVWMLKKLWQWWGDKK